MEDVEKRVGLKWGGVGKKKCQEPGDIPALSRFLLLLHAGNFFFRYVRSVFFFLSLSPLILCFVLEESNCQEH